MFPDMGDEAPDGAAREWAARQLDNQTRVLRGFLRVGAIVLAAMTLLAALVNRSAADASAYAIGALLHVGHLLALRTGQTRRVAASHCVSYVAWITAVLALRTGGLSAPAALVYPPIVLVAGIAWSGRAAMAMAIATSACGAALVLLQDRGLLPPPPGGAVPPFQLWLVLAACVIVTAAFLRYTLSIVRRSMVDALRNEERFADMVRAAPDAMFFTTADRVMRMCNPAASELTGRPCTALCGRRLDELVAGGDAEIARLAAHIADAAEGRVGEPVKLSLRLPGGGDPVPVELRARRAVHAGQVEVHVTARDLRAEVRAERERRRLEEQLGQAQRLEALGRLAGGVAHDLNNLLTIILANVDLPPEARQSNDVCHEVRSAAERAARLTRELLTFGRRQVFAPVVVDLNVVLDDELQQLLRHLLPDDVTLSVRRASVPCPIATERAQIEQVVLNLVANARDALPDGGAIVVATSVSTPPLFAGDHTVPADSVWLTVADDGVGMSEEVKEHIFEPFFTTKDPARGTGLGLSTVHGIVKQSGGQIFLESAPGKGTAFAIAFPRATGSARAVVGPAAGAAVAPAPRAAARPAAAPAPARAPTPAAGPTTILLVEDDPSVRAVAKVILTDASYNVLPARDGTEAKAISDRFDGRIDLLLTDVTMPGEAGPGVASHLREQRAEMRVLYTSGHAEELIAPRGVLPAGVHFLPKPFTRSTLLEKVGQVLASP
jgi:PAS domain S-box-containing protein